MTKLSKMAFDKLRDSNSDRIDFNLGKMWEKSKPATIWVLICLVCEIPLKILKHIIMIICFMPHEIYDALDN